MTNQEARKDKRSAALSSVIAAIGLTVFKLIVGLLTNSLGILAEAAHSGLDLVAAAMTFFAVQVSDKPADKEHPFGHGKIENLSALFEPCSCWSLPGGSSTRPSSACSSST